MLSTLKKISVVVVAMLSLAGGTLAASTTAQARYYHHSGYGAGWVGPAIVGGFMLGAIAASRPYYGYPVYGYGYPAYGYGYPVYAGYPPYGYYGGGCYLQRRVVGYTARGHVVVRRVRVCY